MLSLVPLNSIMMSHAKKDFLTATDTGIVGGGADESPPQAKHFFDPNTLLLSFSAFSEEEHWFRAKYCARAVAFL
jgi:hypothetical protein